MDRETLKAFENLEISPPDYNGAKKVYIIENIKTNTYFQLGEKEASLISLLKDKEVDEARKTSMNLFGKDVLEEFLEALTKQGILDDSNDDNGLLLSFKETRIPLNSLTGMMNTLTLTKSNLVLYHVLNIVFIILGIYTLMTNIDLLNIPSINISFPIIILTVLLLIVTFFIHEAGHAVRLKIAGKNINGIFLVFKYFLPSFFVDASESYKLKNKKEKISVALGGCYFQLSFTFLIIFILSLLNLTDISSVITIYFYISIITIIFNLIPLSKMDGYWALANAIGVNNFSHKAKEIFKNDMSNTLFNVSKIEAPSELAKFNRRLISFYGFADYIFKPLCAFLILIYIYIAFGNLFTLFLITIFILVNIYTLSRFISALK